MIEIVLYEDWMKQQIINLFCLQYNVVEDEFSLLFQNFYETPFQKDKCIRIVAKDDNKIVGFQSFFYWPYSYNSYSYNSFQSGNSLVHPDYRGKGIFSKLLKYVEENNGVLKVDFLIGFPVEASYKSFIRDDWKNTFNLNWYIKIINLFSIFRNFDEAKFVERFSKKRSAPFFNIENSIHIDKSYDFVNWRKIYSEKINSYYYFMFEENGNIIEFEIKIQIRKKILKELIIGDINTNSKDALFFKRAINQLYKRAFSSFMISIVSIAINDASPVISKELLLQSGLKKIKKKIYFIIKSYVPEKRILNPDSWVLYRGDIDTW